MKKRVGAQIFMLFLLIILSFTSCEVLVVPGSPLGNIMGVTGNGADNTPTTDEQESPEEPQEPYNNDEITFDIGEQVNIVFAKDSNIPYSALMSKLYGALGEIPKPRLDSSEQVKNELVLGKCNREISQDAYKYLERISRDNKYIARFAIYSYDNSVAIAFDELDGYTTVIAKHAVQYFSSNYIKDNTPIDIKDAHLYVGTFDVSEYQKGLDKDYEDTMWTQFAEAAGEEAAAALHEMYDALYSDALVDWLAGLFDSEYGGFYYSESARDNNQVLYSDKYYDLLPDIESTSQALGIISSSGMIKEFDDVRDALPEWMQKALVKFMKERQDPNGYFYHPQWTKEMVDTHYSRRGRDLTSALGVLDQLGARPTYDTILEKNGDGKRWDGTPVSATGLTMPIESSAIIAVSRVVAAASEALVPSHLVDDVAFKNYLAGFDDPEGEYYIYEDSYWIGNQLSSQAAQIAARDKTLKEMGKDYSLIDILGDWLDERCIEETGNWHKASADGNVTGPAKFAALNGFMKISTAYNSIGRALPYPSASVNSAIDTITMEYTTETPTVCWLYNSWFSICNIISNVKTHMPDEEAERIVTSIRATLHERAPELIEATMRKQGAFICEDGSFSYTVKSSSATSQSMPVAIPKTKEGDVNATVICTTGTLGNMFDALGYPRVPILYRSDFNRFIDLIEEKKAEIDASYNYAETKDDAVDGKVNYKISEHTNQDSGITAPVIKIYNSYTVTDVFEQEKILYHIINTEEGRAAGLLESDIDYYLKEWKVHNYMYENPTAVALIMDMTTDEVRERAKDVDLNTNDEKSGVYDSVANLITE
ncbi:MAG: hypothetical protein IJX92_08000 [Clostridia bacterium]|nr:hypothetical protein [Clostridia bacterium]